MTKTAPNPADVLVPAKDPRAAVPIHLVRKDAEPGFYTELGEQAAGWLEAVGWAAGSLKPGLVPGRDGRLVAVVVGVPEPGSRDWSPLFAGSLPGQLPAGVYELEGEVGDPSLAALAWGLGCYRFDRYKSAKKSAAGARVLKVAKGVDLAATLSRVEAQWLGRDLINTPPSDLGPEELALAAQEVAKAHGAVCTVHADPEKLAKEFPLLAAVGRASSRPPRLVDITWPRKGAKSSAPRITLVGKGICFDTGGLDIKPAAGMLLMKKDMGGAAAALALAQMIMGEGLDVRLRVLIPAAENAISGSAFRPSDVIRSRAGIQVEIGNTDAEGRLVLADAMALAEEEHAPDLMVTFATLTGAARVALGPDLPPFYCDDDGLAGAIGRAGLTVGDPVWRMPFWAPYDKLIDAETGELSNSYESPFAGSVTAALFLKRFARKSRAYAHFDIYGWVPSAKPGQPKGGEPQAARCMLEVIRSEYCK